MRFETEIQSQLTSVATTEMREDGTSSTHTPSVLKHDDGSISKSKWQN